MKWSKRLESLTEKGELSPHVLPISGCSLHRDAWCLMALAGQYKPLRGLPFWGLPSVIMRHLETADQGSSFALLKVCHSFTQAYHRVSKVQQKTCSLREERTRALSIFTLSSRIQEEPPRWKVVAEPNKDARILGLRRRRIQSGARDKAWSLRALCNKVLLRYKGNRESFWYRHQKGVERVLPC